jgi:hypothetical protein
MTGHVTFQDENIGMGIRRRAKYDDQNPGDLMLSIPKRAGGNIRLLLLARARSTAERDDHQENTLIRVQPLAAIADSLPFKSGGLTFRTGKGVGLLRPGYLYVFRGNRLWRELEVATDGRLSDVDLESVRARDLAPDRSEWSRRPSEGEWLTDMLVPVLLQGRAVIHEFRMAYSEVQWDWGYIQHLETDANARKKRTVGIEHAWPATIADMPGFSMGYPAARVEKVRPLRPRDLGVELMLENPADFTPEFDKPAETELVVRLNKRLQAIAQSSSDAPLALTLECEPCADSLEPLRCEKGLVCVAVPDPLFRIRHSLAQLHLALHYLDAVDVSIQSKPLVHSAMLIRQAIFDPLAQGGQQSALARYADAVDRHKLDEVLETSEKNHAIAIIEKHVKQLRELMERREVESALEDFRTCSDVAICEGYLLLADKLNLLQQIPGVLKAQGVASDAFLFESLKRWVLDGPLLATWVPLSDQQRQQGDRSLLLLEQLKQLAQDQTEIDEALLERLNLQALAYLEKQLQEKRENPDSTLREVQNAGKVSGLVSGALSEWSSSILTVCKRLMEEGLIEQIEIQRIMQSAVANLAIADPTLSGIEILQRGGVSKEGVIVGVSGHGLRRGLTEFDRTEGILTRAKDYLYADLIDDAGERVASTSPARAADDLDEAIKKMAGPTMVFYAPASHAEARKLSLVKVDFAKRVGDIVDGPQVSRGLVVLAAFNLFVETHCAWKVWKEGQHSTSLAFAKAIAGGGSELIAASLKLSEILGDKANDPVRAKGLYRLATKPLFDVKGWVLIGRRLQDVGAQTLVRTVGFASFVSAAIGTVLSAWELRISLSSRDYDAAMGHAVAVTGGLVFLAHPLLAVPGWGWAVLGMAMVVGGSLYAQAKTDDSFEKLLKHGPMGVHPKESTRNNNEKAYYSQLLSLLSDIRVDVQKYSDIEPDPDLTDSDYEPDPEDYVVTIQCPLVSRMKLFNDQSRSRTQKNLKLIVQEVAYLSSSTNVHASGIDRPVESTSLLRATNLRKITARQSLPHRSAVRFLVKRELKNSKYESDHFSVSVETKVRVGIQAVIDSEIGQVVFPAPIYEDFEPFDERIHSNPPSKVRSAFDPFGQPKTPYWYFTEVSA